MSLLLKALQRASKSREALPSAASAPAAATTTAARVSGDGAGIKTDLDFLGRAQTTLRVDPPPRPDALADVISSASADAAAIRPSRFSLMEWGRDNPVYVFAIVVIVFLMFYFAYVFLAINYPTLLTRSAFSGSESSRPLPRAPLTQAPSQSEPGSSASDAAGRPAPMPSLQDQPPLPALKPEEKPVPPSPQTTAQAPTQTRAQEEVITLGPGKTPPAPVPTVSALTPAEPVSSLIPRTGGKPQTPAPVDVRETSEVPQQAPRVAASTASERPIQPAPRSPRVPRTSGTSRDRLASIDRNPSEDRVQIRPSDAGAGLLSHQLDQAVAALQKGDLQKSDALYRGILLRDPRNVDAMIGLGNVAWRRGNPESASDYYQKVLEIDPGNAAAQAELINMAGRVDPVASETRLKQLISREPSGFLYASLGHLYADQGQWAQAQQAYFQAYQLEPSNADYAFNLAVGLEHLSQRKVAVTYYRKALELAGAGGAANFDSGQVQARIEKIGEP